MMSLLESLYCEETQQREDEEAVSSYSACVDDLFCEDHELSSLIFKESEQHLPGAGPSSDERREAVEWILGVVSHYSFTALTAVLSVNYLDRFLDGLARQKQQQQPWMTQLAAVSCLSLAAKVEETHVPLLLDLQMEGSKYVFEAKTIQRMEVVILSSLGWKMNPVTPLSFLDYITRRLGLRSYLCWELVKRCECLLLCFLPDGRFKCHLPSVIATATMVHVMNSNSVEACIRNQYRSQLLGILGINKEEVEECLKQIQEIRNGYAGRHFNKRKFGTVPGSPDAVMDLSFSSSDDSCPPDPKRTRKDA